MVKQTLGYRIYVTLMKKNNNEYYFLIFPRSDKYKAKFMIYLKTKKKKKNKKKQKKKNPKQRILLNRTRDI